MNTPNAMRVTLINPPLVYLTGDLYGDIPYMPTGLLYLAGYLEDHGFPVDFVDGFGLQPRRKYRIDDTLSACGLTEQEIVHKVTEARLVGIGVHSGMSHSIALRLANRIKQRFPSAVVVGGGSHASVVYEELLKGDFDYVCIGEGEHTLLELARCIRDGQGDPATIPGLAAKGRAPLPQKFEENLDSLSFAAIHKLPLDNYWELGMQHAPVQGKYTVITTSRGCVYNCRFCTTPKLLGRKWRTRSAANIVDEIQAAVDRYDIHEVIIQDELFGCRKKAAQEFAREVIKRGLNIRFSLPSGIKVETTDEETLSLLREAGLVYLVFAPESGSNRVLDNMRKPMNFEKLKQLTAHVHRLGIKLSCVFVLGFEDENDDDRRMTRDLALRLTRLGADEISLFIWSPLPGADAFESEKGWSRYEDLNWSPKWRKDFATLASFRKKLYARWLLTRILYHPLASARALLNTLTGRFELKSEMALRRYLQSLLPFSS